MVRIMSGFALRVAFGGGGRGEMIGAFWHGLVFGGDPRAGFE
jgi:hypothetical protein